jgi:hypothetical protein
MEKLTGRGVVVALKNQDVRRAITQIVAYSVRCHHCGLSRKLAEELRRVIGKPTESCCDGETCPKQ